MFITNFLNCSSLFVLLIPTREYSNTYSFCEVEMIFIAMGACLDWKWVELSQNTFTRINPSNTAESTGSLKYSTSKEAVLKNLEACKGPTIR